MTLEIAVTDDLEACHALRHAVFVIEQEIDPAEEWDDLDGQAVHLLARQDGKPVGTARLLVTGDTGRIGRLCVLREARGLGVGAGLVRASLAHFRTQPGVKRVVLGAQCYAIGFYEGLGFEAHGPVYSDAGIPHRDMVQEL